MSSNSLNQQVVASTGATTCSSLSQASSQNELVEENLRLQQQLQTQSAEVARSHEELYLCKKKIEQLTNSQFADAEETPREVDLFADENMEEIFETIETLRLRVEQLQVNCEKLAQEKAAVEQKVIDREKQYQATSSRLQEEINFLRKTNLQLLSSQENSNGSNTEDVPGWVKEALDAECLRTELQNAEKEVESLQIAILEKDKYIANLEWQLVDSDATIATLQAERDRLTMEIDCSVVPDHLSSVQGSLEALGAVAEPPVQDHYEYYIEDHSFDATEGFRRRVRKPARRHLSDLTRRDFSEIEDARTLCQKTSIRSLSDVDVPRHVTSAENLPLGTLKRSTNFNNINALDESEKFKLDDSVDLTTGSLASGSLCDDSSMENVANIEVGKGLAKGKWQSFGSDSEIGKSDGRDLQHLPLPVPTKTDNNLNAWGSGGDVCQGGDGSKDAIERTTCSGDWQDVDASVSKSKNVKNDSCRSSSSAYCSADEGNSCTSPDLWGAFTPDSIIDVSTGKVIDLNGEVENSAVKATPGQSPNGECSTDSDSCGSNKKTAAGDLLDGCSSTSTGWASFERSTSVRSEGTPQLSSTVIGTCHSKQNSEPASLERSASVNDGYRKSNKVPNEVLEEYQKWKVTGSKGEPPAKLKISQC